MNFIDKPFKVNYGLTGNLSSWNDPIGIAARENIINMVEVLENDKWCQEYECKPTDELK